MDFEGEKKAALSGRQVVQLCQAASLPRRLALGRQVRVFVEDQGSEDFRGFQVFLRRKLLGRPILLAILDRRKPRIIR